MRVCGFGHGRELYSQIADYMHHELGAARLLRYYLSNLTAAHVKSPVITPKLIQAAAN